jgi:hypothetical protein
MEINSEGYHVQEEKEEKEECIICLDEVEKEWRELECRHRYHKQCIENWIKVKARCPLCMKQINDKREERNSMIERNINDVAIEEIHMIGIKRFLICMCCVIILLVIMVITSS